MKDVFEICKEIMASGKIETFKPFENSKGVFQIKKYAKSQVNGITERLFEDCRKINKTSVEKSLKVKALSCFIKSLNDTNKFVNGYEIGIKKLVTMFVSWTDEKYTFNLKDTSDLKTIAMAIGYSCLMGFVPTNKMLVIILNRDDSIVIRLIDKQENFYQWKETKTKEEKTEEKSIEYEELIDFLKVADADLLLDLSKDLSAILKERKIFKINKKAA